MKVNYHGSCHCGDISFSFASDIITSAMICTCTICRRKGGYLSNFVIPAADLNLDAGESKIGTYQFGTEVAKHHFCERCGIFTHVETRLNPGCYRVNLGCIDDLDIYSLDVEVFDGQSI